jgi:hypothetical protein
MPRKKAEEPVEETVEVASTSEKEILLALYDELQARGIRSISDLENQIARAE